VKLGYIGIDQYKNTYPIKKYPRKELMEKLGGNAERMYIDDIYGNRKHIGYVINDCWIRVYEVHEWNHK